MFNVGYFAFDAYARAAEGLDGPTLTRLREAAREAGVAVLAGTVVEDLAETEGGPAEEGLANTAVLFDADGSDLLTYRKHHLFGYGSAETDLLVPGERLATADLGGFTVGVTTCYDLRFPELYRRLAVPPRRTLGDAVAGARNREPLVPGDDQRQRRVRRRDAPGSVDGVRPLGDDARQ